MSHLFLKVKVQPGRLESKRDNVIRCGFMEGIHMIEILYSEVE